MHEEAEQGVAAHWRYKEGGRHDLNLAERLKWLRMLLDWQKEWQDEALVGKDLEEHTLYVFTKDGEVVALPMGATPIDFAFAVHTDLGLKCKGAYVNERIVPLNYRLAMADQVEIITHKEAHPSRDWLRSEMGFIKSAKARSKLRLWFKNLDSESIHSLREESKQSALESRAEAPAIANTRSTEKASKTGQILLAGMSGLPYQFAKCCTPEMNQAIIGYLTTQRGVVIHQQHCRYIARLDQKRRARLLPAAWSA